MNYRQVIIKISKTNTSFDNAIENRRNKFYINKLGWYCLVGIILLIFNQYTFAQENDIIWKKHSFPEFGLEMEYPENWEIKDIVGGERIIRSGSEEPIPIRSFEPPERTSNPLPDTGIELPERVQEALRDQPQAFFNIYEANPTNYLRSTTDLDFLKQTLYHELDNEISNQRAFWEINEESELTVSLEGLDQKVFRVNAYDDLEEPRTSLNYLVFSNALDNKIYEIEYGSDYSRVDDYAPIFEHMLNSIKTSSTVSGDGMNMQDKTEGNLKNIECGSVILQDVSLVSDLDCISDGLIIINQEGITVDLNGHSIIGPGTTSQKVGIMIGESKNINITGNGTIKNFQSGILSSTSNNIGISSIKLQGNEMGSFLTNSKNAALEKSVYDGNNVGIAIHSGLNNSVANNFFNSNALAGITNVKSSETLITSNEIKGSKSGIVIDLQSKNNMIESNTISQSSENDLNNGNGLSPTTNNNTFTKNTCKISTPSGLCDPLT